MPKSWHKYLLNCNPVIPAFNLVSGTLSVVDTVRRRILGRAGHYMKPVTPGKAVFWDLAGQGPVYLPRILQGHRSDVMSLVCAIRFCRAFLLCKEEEDNV